jgi:hypothetical protein
MVGIGLQTAGVLLVLLAVREEGWRGGRMMGACAAFALAFCTKQHFVVAAIISTGLIVWKTRQGHVPFKLVERGLLLALAIVVLIFGSEELLTGGRMSRAIFLAARSAGYAHPGSWYRAGIVLIATAGGTQGILTLLAAAGLASAWSSPGVGPATLGVTGASLVGLVLLLVITQLVLNSALITAAGLGVIAVIAPIWLLAALSTGLKEFLGDRLDKILWVYFLGEMAMVLLLYRASTGAWVNYAIQAAVFLAILTGRALGRVLEARPPVRSQVLIAAGALVCLGAAANAIRNAEYQRRVNREALATFLQEARCDPSAVFVVGQAGMNRLHGRLDLVYDEWLYPVFESLGLAEPRAIWLRRALTLGRVQFVVNANDNPRIDGLPQSLPELGFFRKYHVGPFFVWENRRNPSTRRMR